MSAHVCGVTEIVGMSPDGVDAAIEAGIARASTTLRGLDWFEVSEIRSHIAETGSLPGRNEDRFPDKHLIAC